MGSKCRQTKWFEDRRNGWFYAKTFIAKHMGSTAFFVENTIRRSDVTGWQVFKLGSWRRTAQYGKGRHTLNWIAGQMLKFGRCQLADWLWLGADSIQMFDKRLIAGWTFAKVTDIQFHRMTITVICFFRRAAWTITLRSVDHSFVECKSGKRCFEVFFARRTMNGRKTSWQKLSLNKSCRNVIEPIATTG